MSQIELADVSRRYGPRWALVHVQVSIASGEAVMLTGPNGSGKSTLIKCLATALRIHKGSLRFDGVEAWDNRSKVRRDTAYLGHQHHVWEDLSGQDNLRAWASLGGYQPDINGLLERVGLDPARHDPLRTFSAGMRRRLSLARMLIKTPKVVLLDEPFNALDPAGRDLMVEVANDLISRGTTLVMASHMPHEGARICSRVVSLESGQVVYDGSASTFLQEHA